MPSRRRNRSNPHPANRRAQLCREVIPVYLVELHPVAALHLREVLESDPSFDVHPLQQLLNGAPNTVPLRASGSVLVYDDRQQSGWGQYVAPLRCCLRNTRILVIQEAITEDRLYELVLMGACGFVAYDDIPLQLKVAVQAVSTGKLWFPPGILHRLVYWIAELGTQTTDHRNKLTAREKEIAALLSRELSNKEIGSALNVSERTVKFHVNNIFTKLGVHNRYVAGRMLSVSAREASPFPSRSEKPILKQVLRNIMDNNEAMEGERTDVPKGTTAGADGGPGLAVSFMTSDRRAAQEDTHPAARSMRS